MAKIIKGVLFSGDVRITAIESTDMVEQARVLHQTSPLASAALGRTISACAMISSSFKNELDRMSVTIKGDGIIRNIVVAAKAGGEVKGYISDPQVILPLKENGKLDVGGAVGKGTLTVVKDLGLKIPWTGTVELQSGEIGDDFAYYMYTSEQTPCVFYVGVLVDVDYSIKSASGLIVEPLPDCSEEHLSAIEENANKFSLLNTILADGKSLEQALDWIFEGMDFKPLEESSPYFKCDCSKERIELALSSLPKEELIAMAKEDDGAEVVCQFCHSKYQFSANELIDFTN